MTEGIEVLVARARQGDRVAEGALAQRAAARALQAAAVAMGDVHAARDVSQEVAVRVLRGLGSLRAPDRFDAWVYRITVSEIRRAYRQRSRRGEIPLEATVEAMHGSRRGETPANEMLFARVGLRAALAELSSRERTALALRYVHDLGDDEIAKAMRCRPGTVRSLLSRARTKLSTSRELADHAPSAANGRVELRNRDVTGELS
jgi:RNA polymerase sigma-70 factor (ECF subfamily)